VQAKQPTFITLLGAKTVAQLEDGLAAKTLSASDTRELEGLGSFAGSRYGADQMRHLDSEKA